MSRIVRKVMWTIAITMSLFSAAVVLAQDKATQAPAAQAAPPPDARPISDEDIQMLRKDIRAQRKDLIAVNMRLMPDEAEKFWPVYEQYISELVATNNKKYALIKQYVQTGGVFTDAEAEEAALRRKYIPIFRKVLSPKNEAMFYQLDRRVQLMIDLQLMALIPMVEP